MENAGSTALPLADCVDQDQTARSVQSDLDPHRPVVLGVRLRPKVIVDCNDDRFSSVEKMV